MPASTIAASLYTEEDEGDQTEQDMIESIDGMDIDELKAQFGLIMAEVVIYHCDND